MTTIQLIWRSIALTNRSACASSIIGLIYRVKYYTLGSDITRLVIPLWATSYVPCQILRCLPCKGSNEATQSHSMSEEAAGVMIFCMPPTASFFRRVEGPVRSWLSAVSWRALRTTRFSRSGKYAGSSQSNLKKKLESRRKEVYLPSDLHGHHTAWVNTEAGNYPLQQLDSTPNLSSSNVWKTQLRVTRAA